MASSTYSEKYDHLPWWIQRVWRHSKYRRLAYFLLVLAFWCVLVPPVYMAYLREGGNADTAIDFVSDSSPSYIHVIMMIQQADFNRQKLAIYVTPTPYGDLANKRLELTKNITAYFAFQSYTFPSGNIMQSFDLTVPLIGYPRMYPFDSYETFYEVSFVDTDSSSDDGRDKLAVPIRVTVYGSVQSLSFNTSAHLVDNSPNAFNFDIVTSRTRTTMFFSVFIMLVMWGLSLTLLMLAYQVLIERREVPPPLMVVGVSMLFALPPLRNSQPGVPNVGCASDALSYFWCLFIIAMCSITIIQTFIMRWRRGSVDPYMEKSTEEARVDSSLVTTA
ncbi:hypothetical protein H4R34_001353 [Dimargaris verticillata]|uniref:Transmembrane protein n=1 Tax=Dimargaris verticillata TaxID=2761393 RepID=A0A9W8EAE6_9FUNG|nr:hypothetical protein H4R34_001353 [Dimargaris verticillata]